MKVRVTIDLDDDESLSEMGSLERGVYGVDKEGVYHMWYGSRTSLVEFTNTKVVSK